MEFIRTIANETSELIIGIYGLLILYCLIFLVSEALEGLVKWIGNKVVKFRRTYSIRK